jgi:phosphonate transport system ATP-binding protein
VSSPYALRIEELVVRYGRGAPVIAEVSLSLAPREVVGLIGASGAGKSTLLRAVQRLVEPVSGRVWLDGTELTRLPRAELRGARRRA